MPFKAYLSIIQRSFMKKIEYRGELLLWLLLDSIPIFTLIVLWSNVFSGGTVIAGYDFSQVAAYSVITMWIMAATGAHFESWRVTQVREGKIDLYLTRPLPYLMDIILCELGNKLLYFFCLTLPVYGLITWLLSLWQPLALPHITFSTIITFIGLLLFGYSLEMAFGLLIVILSFWFEGADGLEHFKWVSISLLSGQIMPLVFLPNWLQQTSAVLPFKYAYSVPIGVLQGTQTVNWVDWMVMVAWVLVAIVGLGALWKRAIMKYSSAGG